MRLGLPEDGPRSIASQARRLKLWLKQRLVLDVGPLRGGAVLVAGSGRSGTTWVADGVAEALGARLIFEPFVVDERGLPAALDRRVWREPQLRLGYSHYVAATSADAAWHDATARILSGSIVRYWQAIPAAPGIYRHRVIKAIRANLLIANVADRWPEVPILWVRRHPLDVVNSQLRMRHEKRWEFDWRPDHALQQRSLMTDWLKPFEREIRGASNLVERLACRWCVENYVPQRQLGSASSVLPLSFHELRTDAEPWQAIAGMLGRTVLDREPRLDGRGAPPSFTAHGAASELRDPSRLDYLSASQQRDIMRIVGSFGLEELTQALRRT